MYIYISRQSYIHIFCIYLMYLDTSAHIGQDKEALMWVVVKIMVPFARHLVLGDPKGEHKFDNHPKHESVSISTCISISS